MAMTRITKNLLNVLVGFPLMHHLTGHAKLSANVTITLKPGRVAHRNSVGELETGIGPRTMPLFIYTPTDGRWVKGDANGGNVATDYQAYKNAFPTGNVTFIPGTVGMEFATAEYLDTTYAPDTMLTAAIANTTLATGGLLKPGTLGTDPICGLVSRGRVAKMYDDGHDRLCFYTWWGPVYP